uniref:Uncharacterized protein n=1 Tax=Cajanus cajan TaxID=3821 RepID=A0A151SRI3_CAJCA|nr:hypothetical protein KK1_003614 [Cajanus cajan]
MASRTCLVTMSQYPHTRRATRTCACSPSRHPGSFRCSMHRKPPRRPLSRTSSPNRWDSSMAAKANSLKAILLQMLKPSNHDVPRRRSFQPKPSRFSLMNANAPAVAVN